MDIQMPVLDGFAATERIQELSLPTRVILFSINRGLFYARRAALVGAKGFLPKDDLGIDLWPAIQAVYRGETVFKE
jgi:DNA-binding NarL/FixJ family response regulator